MAVFKGLGSAASPSITFSADTNTGIFSSGADRLAISTNGTERVVVDASGRILVGGSSVSGPFSDQGQLQVIKTDGGSAFATYRFTNDTGGSILYIGKSRGAIAGTNTAVIAGDTLGSIVFAGADGSSYQRAVSIRAIVGGTPGADPDMPGALLFEVTGDGSSTPSERMRLDSSGRLGLGTSSPQAVLHSAATITGGTPATSGTTDPNVIARFQGGSVGFDLGGTAGGLQWIQPRSVNNYATNFGLSICPNGGNVGIGTTSPGSALQVQGLITGTAVTQSAIDTTAERLTKVGDFGVGGDAAILLGTSDSLDTLQNNGLFAWLTLEPAGSPGSTAQMLHVQRSSASRSQLVFRSVGTQQAFIRGYTAGAWQPWYQLYHQNTEALINTTSTQRFGTNNTERLRIDSTGNVGIGTTSPAAFMDISSSSSTDLLRIVASAGATGGAAAGVLFSAASNLVSITALTADVLALGTDNTERMRITSAGNVGIGTTSPNANLQIGNGSAVALGSTAPFAWVSARANSAGNNPTTPQELLRLSWQEGSQDLGSGEGCAINFAASLVGDSGTFYNVASIASSKEGGSDAIRNSSLAFFTSADGTAEPTERMRITSAGNVGIGTTSPNSALQVEGLITGTAVTQSAIDTTAERLTKVGDFGIGNEFLTAETLDLDDLIQTQGPTRILVTSTAAQGSPPGFSSVNFVLNLSRSPSAGTRSAQLAFNSPGAGSNRLAIRGFGDSGITPWAEIYSSGNILGTVSESSGVPTGAIIQRGSNANGEFVRYADGTMQCWIKGTLVDHTASLSGTARLVGSWTFPATFSGGAETVAASINLPAHSGANFVGCTRTDVISWGSGDNSTTSTQISVFFTGDVSTTNARIENMQANAFGRWY